MPRHPKCGTCPVTVGV
ncbi:hypothetical protein [Donghicola tyrosinivorans]